MTTRAMSFVGYHNSGKTTLVAKVAEHLRATGHRVGIIKSSRHGFDFGHTDTGKLASTGCPVAGINPEQTMIVLPRSMPIMSVWTHLEADILLVEGGKSLDFLPRILLPRNPDAGDDPQDNPQDSLAALDNGLALGTWAHEGPPKLPVLKDIEEVAELVLQRGFLLPALNCGACGRDDCGALARDVVAGKADPDECRAVQDSFSITVNKVPLAMNPFVATIMASTIRGMLCQLKGYAPGTIDIHLEES
ncbi:molybdopterin-guanine dinucleotide biosynthesis protein B [Desulfonatronum thiosulfatophilum]|uniref:Molybdopterin-guanine dinucleotide biosynthesis protein B n=1 Tax=Desulfonatronum thiosulfatophilum TaxID=617002 RepID=A0A1G6B7L0_9BACT|nr:molybdopterin-guanine dinucleotide biosynthesis protein MobB [Desulfonatronum thiosulfatophilum]SDB16403.1 molybdopterin-guanine dinucleotide biosynthesis protein B [Desulfonatronum thiosulfatophilum]